MKMNQYPADGSNLSTSATPSTVTALSPVSLSSTWACVFADKANGADIKLGPMNAATLYSLAAGNWFVIAVPPNKGGAIDLSTWFVQSTSASQNYRIEYWG